MHIWSHIKVLQLLWDELVLQSFNPQSNLGENSQIMQIQACCFGLLAKQKASRMFPKSGGVCGKELLISLLVMWEQEFLCTCHFTCDWKQKCSAMPQKHSSHSVLSQDGIAEKTEANDREKLKQMFSAPKDFQVQFKALTKTLGHFWFYPNPFTQT